MTIYLLMVNFESIDLLNKKTLSSLKSPPLPSKHGNVPSEMALLSNTRWQNRKERSNRSTNNGDMAKVSR